MPTKVTTIDTIQLARLLDIAPRTVRHLAQAGVLARARNEVGEEIKGRYELVANVRAYVRYLREQARLDDASESKYIMLRNAKMGAESEMSALRVNLFKDTLHRSDDVELIMANMLTAFKARVIAIPSRVSRQLIGQTKFHVVYDLLMAEIELALREMCDYDRSAFAPENAAYLEAEGADDQGLNGEDDAEGQVKATR
jgi:phage terminase Nu1 subunit (DNA packaging protein)